MKHFNIIRFTGDWQGSKLEKALKEYVRGKFDNSVCSVEAVSAIIGDICRKIDELHGENPKCKKPELRYDHAHKILLFANSEPDKNNGLIIFSTAPHCYVTPEETLLTAVDEEEI